MDKKILTILVVIAGVALGAGATALISNPGVLKRVPTITQRGSLTPVPTLEEFILEGDNEPNNIRVHVVNASLDDNLESEFDMDLTDAGYTVLDPERQDPIETTTLYYKESTYEQAQQLMDWLAPRYVPKLSNTLDPDSEYDLELIIGIVLDDES